MIDFLLLFVAAACQGVSAYLGFRVSYKRPSQKNRWRIEAAFIACGIIGFIAVIAAGVRSSAIQSATDESLKKILGLLQGGHSDAPIPKPALYVECQDTFAGSVTVPATGKVYELSLFPWDRANEGTVNGLNELISRPGAIQRLPFEMDQFGGSSKKCSVTNYGDTTIFNATINLRLIFLAAEKQENGSHSGNVVLDRQWWIRAPEIPAKGVFEFYPYSASPNFVHVFFPETATAEIGTSKRPETIDVRVAPPQPLRFDPFWLGVPSK